MKRHLLTIGSKSLNVLYLCYRHASFFAFFIFNKFPATYLLHMCVEYDKQSKSPQTRYNRTNIYDRYYIRTHVYVFLFSVKRRVFELLRVWPWRWPCGGTPYMVFIGPVFHYTNQTCSKTVGHCGYEWVEKEMDWFAEDMS